MKNMKAQNRTNLALLASCLLALAATSAVALSHEHHAQSIPPVAQRHDSKTVGSNPTTQYADWLWWLRRFPVA
jgi:hypothetical protein